MILALAAALLVCGCGSVNCNGAANDSAAAGECGLHTTFFAARTADQPAAALRKS
ncbi:MAG TPA: hypothetical protein VHZ26_07800 [Caulobacteraceae bacterium]|nr:hypothetical protein [Caulobacteraceae bacterium]